ncbi:MAG: glycosyltransferase [Alphaproteobacteria bacterium]
MSFPAIVVIAYNRSDALLRLLTSLAKAKFGNHDDVKLIISIDSGKFSDVIDVANQFNWQYGEKEVIVHSEQKGLRKHILWAGDLSDKYGSIIMLEDDLYVSPYFPDYAENCISYYQNDEKIAGISLFSPSYNETAGFPFSPINDGTDIYFMQLPSSCGQAWTSKQWKSFKIWLKECDNNIPMNHPAIPSNVRIWAESSWKKLFVSYMAHQDLFFVYPRISLTSNFGDRGTHYAYATTTFQNQLLYGEKKWSFISLEKSLAIYDGWGEILSSKIRNLLPIDKNDNLVIDLYGAKNISEFKDGYILTCKDGNNALAHFSRTMKPQDANIINSIKESSEFKLFKISDTKKLNLKQRFARLLFFAGDLSPFDALFLPIVIILKKLPNLINKIKPKWIKK